MTTIFLDMDGVISNWTLQVMKILNLSDEQINWHLSNWSHEDTAEQLGITDSYMWTVINRTPSFWDDIPVFEHAHELVKELRKLGEVHICTSHGMSKDAPSGKVRWLAKHKFKFHKNVIITPNKHLLAGENRILIDDSQKKVDSFLLYGGHAVLFPALGNKNSEHLDNRVEFTLNEVKELLK